MNSHTWSAWEADIDPGATDTAATLYDYFNDLWADAARVDDETAHKNWPPVFTADVHICTHARRLADIAVLEAAQHDAR
jgi:predicted lipoprotein with Yx(FWY)xxD motif